MTTRKPDDQTLAARLKTGRIGIAEAARIMRQLVAAVERAHRENFLASELTPLRVRLVPGERGSLVARVDPSVIVPAGAQDRTESQTLASGTFAERARYMSPEECAGRELDERSDIYKLGVIFYEMVAGRPPFDAGSAVEIARQHAERVPPPLPKFAEPLLQPLTSLLARALEKSPASRMTAAEFARDLRNLEYLAERMPETERTPRSAEAPAPTTRSAAGNANRLEPALRSTAERSAAERPAAGRFADEAAAVATHAAGAGVTDDTAERSGERGAGVPGSNAVSSAAEDETIAASAPPKKLQDDTTTEAPRIKVARRERPAASPPAPMTGADGQPVAPDAGQIVVPVAGEANPRRRPRNSSALLPLGLALAVCALVFVALRLRSNDAGASARNETAAAATGAAADPAANVAGAPATQSAYANNANGAGNNSNAAERASMVFSRPRGRGRNAADSPPEQRLAGEFDRWIAAVSRQDSSALRSLYAPRLDFYYGARDVSRRVVRARKSRARIAGDLRISEPEISFGPDNRSATMRFTLSRPAGGGEVSTTRELRWALTDEGWRIVAEREISG